MGDRARSGPTRVERLLTAAVPELAGRLLEIQIRHEWPTMMGAEFARQCQPARLRNGTLDLVVDNSPWLQEVKFREAELRARLARRYGERAVRSLRVFLGTLAPERGALRSRAAVPPPKPSSEAPLAEEDTRMVETATGAVRDPELRAVLRRLLVKACRNRPGQGAAS
ncbi:MAG: DUF721 domain-containing protein [Candidatus Methylomirabilia bacterium]